MKMNYAPKNSVTNFQSSRAKNGMSFPMKILLVVVIVLVIVYTFLPSVLPLFFLSLVSPIWKADAEAKRGATSLEQLRTTYVELLNTTSQNDVLLTENKELKELLGRTTVSEPLLATILKKPPFSAYDSFILDVGGGEGIKVGNRVYAVGNIPIGEIEEVIGDTSRVRLYSTAGEKFDVLVGPSHIEATALGKGGGHFEVSLPRDTKIKQGDEVLVPSLGDSFVGTVDGIASEVSEPFAKILFHHPVNIYEQRWVIIDTDDNE